jgi:hypothetical protein
MSKVVIPIDARPFPIMVVDPATGLSRAVIVRKGQMTTSGLICHVDATGHVYVQNHSSPLKHTRDEELEEDFVPPPTPEAPKRSVLDEAALIYDGPNVIRTHER